LCPDTMASASQELFRMGLDRTSRPEANLERILGRVGAW
jgi:hypothetical protein